MEKFYAGTMSLTVRYALTREQAREALGPKTKKHTSGIVHRGWRMETKFAPSHDTLTLLEVLRRGWEQRPRDAGYEKPFFVAITFGDLIREDERQETLFGDPDRRGELSRTMDKLNLKYGHTTLHFAGMLPARESAPTRIAFTQIPVQYGVEFM